MPDTELKLCRSIRFTPPKYDGTPTPVEVTIIPKSSTADRTTVAIGKNTESILPPVLCRETGLQVGFRRDYSTGPRIYISRLEACPRICQTTGGCLEIDPLV